MSASLTLVVATLCLLVQTNLPGVRGEVFSSMATLRSLVSNQATLLVNLDEYVQREEERLVKLRNLINEKRAEVEEYQTYPEVVLAATTHPSSAYSLIRDWSFISDLVHDNWARTDLENKNFQARALLPMTSDRLGAARALIRLQRVYNLSIDDLATGNVLGHHSQKALTGRDFYDIGTSAKDMNLVTTAVQWLEKALAHRPPDLPLTDILYTLGMLHSQASEFATSRDYYRRAFNEDPTNTTLKQQYMSMSSVVEVHGDNGIHKYSEVFPNWKINYEALCRKDHQPAREYMNTSWCAYQSHLVPYAPYKMEVMNTDPWIVMYYDVISDWETEYVKHIAAPDLNRAVVGDPASAYATEERVSKVAWLWDQLGDPTVQLLSRRVQHVTGLQTSYQTLRANAEPFQVVNYGMGGQYEPHVDVYENASHLANVPEFLKNTGDRVATFMFYLSNVKEGGATVFPLLNVYVPPVKNAAAFWYNIHRNGDLDLRTQHAGCPVLVGEKWVANKWVREGGQIFLRPCGPKLTSTEPESEAAIRGL